MHGRGNSITAQVNIPSTPPHPAAKARSVDPSIRVSMLTLKGETNARSAGSDTSRSAPAPASLPIRLQDNVDRIRFDLPSLAPMAFVRFCLRYPLDCRAPEASSAVQPVTLTKERKAELAKINHDVNRAIRPQSNTNGVVAEEWLISPPAGDCNDYAVTKRHELLKRGWPSHALMLAEVVVPSGGHHLVLVVRTREQEVVLDNLKWNVLPVSKTHYYWVRAQQTSNPKFWAKISVRKADRVAMNGR
jgi:predicted transglutaminase-like cysteine proteinase